MKVTTFGDLLHHMINKTNFDSESDFITAHSLVDEKYPAEAILVSQETDPAEAPSADTPATS